MDLNTENPAVAHYLIDTYNKYIDMGVDAFRVDTVKHVSRYDFNKYFIPAWKNRGGSNFYIFGEVATRYRDVWNSGIPAISTPFYTWKESKAYPGDNVDDYAANKASVEQNWADNSTTAGQPTSNNAILNGNSYHTPDYSMKSGLDVIDFPMHWAFKTAKEAFGMRSGDQYYNDATWNVTYVDSHDYAPDQAPENERFAGTQDTWAENLDLLFTFRGIPAIFYGSEIEFQKGAVIDPGPTKPLSETGRAYYGDHLEGSVTVQDYGKYTNATGQLADSLNYPLAQHIRKLNLMRRAIPALQKGQYSTENVSGELAFKRRYTDASSGIDSFVLVTISGDAQFTGIPNGTYVDAVTGDTKTVTNGTITLNCSGKGNARVYVLNGSGKIGDTGTYLK
ncbi:alpha-amylase family glycosyl hydrolase [Paenibacillus hexagrammi]